MIYIACILMPNRIVWIRTVWLNWIAGKGTILDIKTVLTLNWIVMYRTVLTFKWV